MRLSDAFHKASYEKKLKMYTEAAKDYTNDEVIKFYETFKLTR